MFLLQLNRLLWKEYRVNRALWFSCLCVGAVIQLLAWWSAMDAGARFHALTVPSTLISVLFAVGCGATLFAGEREEQTSDWLLALAARTDSVLIAKFLFGVVATILLQSMLVLESLVLTAFTPRVDSQQIFQNAAYPIGLLVLAWSIFGSMVSRRVLIAVPTAACWYVVFASIVLWFVFMARRTGPVNPSVNFDFEFFVATRILSALAIGASVWMGWRWCHGNYWDGRHLEWIFHQLMTQIKSRFPRIDWVRPIPRSEECSQPSQRVQRRLIWHERYRESMHKAFLIAICSMILAVVGIEYFWQPGNRPQHIMALLIALSIVGTCSLPFAMGLMSYSDHGTRGRSQFLWNLGVDPDRVWITKQFVWLPRSIGIPLLIVLWAVFWMWTVAEFGSPFPPIVREQWANGFWAVVGVLYADFSPVIGNVFWSLLLCYACGQFCSVIFRRVILAVFVGLLFCAIFGLWIWGMIRLQVPLWWSTGLPVVFMLSVSRWQTRYWLADDSSWSRHWRLIAVSLICPVSMIGLLAANRVSGVYLVKTVTPEMLDTHVLLDWWKTALLVQQQIPASHDRLVSDALLQLCVDGPIDRRRDDAAWKADAKTILELLASDVSTLNQHVTARDFAFPFRSLEKVNHILNRAAEIHFRDYQFDKVVEYRLASLKLVRIFATKNDSRSWISASFAQEETLQALLRELKQRPEFSKELAGAVEQISAELQRFPSLANASAVDYLEDYNRFVATNDSEFLSTVLESYGMRNDSDSAGHSYGFDNSTYLAAQYARLPWERLRYARLLLLQAQIDYQECLALDRPDTWTFMMRVYHSRLSDQRQIDFDAMRRTLEPLVKSTFESNPVHQNYRNAFENRVKRVLEPMQQLTALAQTVPAKE